MITVKKIEKAVGELDKHDLSSFRDWFTVFDQTQWDAQIEQDISQGKLDNLAAEAISEHKQGNSRSL